MSERQRILVGCAGWNIRREDASIFPTGGSHLQRYAANFSAVEINSSFYRPHRPATYARWAETVPAAFRFSVKFPKTITHTNRLCNCLAALGTFLDDVIHLGNRLGCLLLQLPPSLAFDSSVVTSFFQELRTLSSIPVVCEPRHRSWFDQGPDQLLREFDVARVAADPALLPDAANPGGDDELVYYRLHGSPRMYYSAYATEYLDGLAHRLRFQAASRTTWCIFDNTAAGAAARDALELISRLSD